MSKNNDDLKKLFDSPKEKKSKFLTVINEETGEIEARIKLHNKTFGKKRWLAMFQNALAWVSEQHDMTGEQLKVMLNLISSMEYDNRILYDREKIAKSVGIRPNNVSRALKVLRDKDIIYKDPDNDKIYKLNPYIGHKGTKHYSNNVVEFEKAKWDKAEVKETKK